ncbi:hypothetical protein R6Q59_008780 [Mikania micrantha]
MGIWGREKYSLLYSRAYWVSRSIIAWDVDDVGGSCFLYSSKLIDDEKPDTVHPEVHGGYLAFTSQDSAGILHLKKLSDAGLTHIHLLPTFQFGDVDDQKENWKYGEGWDFGAVANNVLMIEFGMHCLAGLHLIILFNRVFLQVYLCGIVPFTKVDDNDDDKDEDDSLFQIVKGSEISTYVGAPVAHASQTVETDSLLYSPAYWVSRSIIAWDVDDVGGSSFLYSSKSASLSVAGNIIEGVDSAPIVLFLTQFPCFGLLMRSLILQIFSDIRDFSSNDSTVYPEVRGGYLAFILSYNPVLWGVPKGSYAINADGAGYYLRRNADGFIENNTCVNKTASEHFMVDRLIVDDILNWVVDYKFLTTNYMDILQIRVKNVLKSLSKDKDKIDGSIFFIYGEGWDFGEVANNGRGINASQLNLGGSGIGRMHCLAGLLLVILFNRVFSQDYLCNQMVMTMVPRLMRHVGMAANLKDYVLTYCDGQVVKGSEILTYGGALVAYALQPVETIKYVSAHDNETLFDIISLKVDREHVKT